VRQYSGRGSRPQPSTEYDMPDIFLFSSNTFACPPIWCSNIVLFHVFIVQSSVLFLNMHAQLGITVSPKISRYWVNSKALFIVSLSSPVTVSDCLSPPVKVSNGFTVHANFPLSKASRTSFHIASLGRFSLSLF